MLLLLFPQGVAAAYSLSADSGTLTLSGQDATLTYVPIASTAAPQTGGSVLAGGASAGRKRRTSGSWVRIDEESTPQERAAKDAALEARLAEEAYQRKTAEREAARLAAERAEAERLANLRHFTLHATGAELRVTKKRSHKLIANRSTRAGERFLHIRPTAAQMVRTYRLEAIGGAVFLQPGTASVTHRDPVQALRVATEQTLAELRATQAQLKRLKDDNDAMQLLLLAA